MMYDDISGFNYFKEFFFYYNHIWYEIWVFSLLFSEIFDLYLRLFR